MTLRGSLQRTAWALAERPKEHLGAPAVEKEERLLSLLPTLCEVSYKLLSYSLHEDAVIKRVQSCNKESKQSSVKTRDPKTILEFWITDHQLLHLHDILVSGWTGRPRM